MGKKVEEERRKIPNKVEENYEDFLRFILSFCNFKLYYLNKNIKKYFNYFYVFKWFPVWFVLDSIVSAMHTINFPSFRLLVLGHITDMNFETRNHKFILRFIMASV